MQVFTVKVSEKIQDKFFTFLKSFPCGQVDIVESKTMDDWSFLEEEIQQGEDSGISLKSHAEILQNIKQKYA